MKFRKTYPIYFNQPISLMSRSGTVRGD